jgi:ABC-2 type transport system permease protein
MFGKIAGFEFRYQLRQPIFWVAVFFFGLLSFGSVASSNVQIGSTANVHKNGAFVIGQTHLIMSVIFMFVTAAFVANVIVRDDETAYGPIIRSTPISKFDYLYGRFVGAFAAGAIAFASVPVGMWLGSVSPWVDPDTLSPFAIQPYLFAYAVMALPFLFLTAALFFALTTVTRSMMWTYVGVIVLMVFRAIFGVVTSKPGWEHFASIWDPFGAASFGVATHYWTASERNLLLPAIQGDFLWNKLIWLGVAVAILAATYQLFDFQSAETSGRSRKAAKLAQQAEAPEAPPALAGRLAKPLFDRRTVWAQLIARTRLDARQVFGSPAFFVLLGLGAANSMASLWLATDVSTYGGKIYPVSRVMIQQLNGAFTAFALIIAIYYAGELVWREREKHTHEIIDATPVPDWIFILPKTVAIVLVLVSTLLVSVAVAMLLQAIRGYFGFEIGKFLLWYVLPNAIDFTLFVALAMFIQALSPHKFVGWAVMAAFMVSTLVLGNLGFEDGLYQYAGSPDIPLSDMNGQGRYWIGAYWFRLYWSAFAAVLLVLAYGLWRRGTEARFMPRLRRLPRRLQGGAGVILAVALAVFIGSGVYIFINTHIWNPYRTKLGDEQLTADFEKGFLRYETVPQPKVAKSTLDVQVYPHETRLETRGRYVIQNRTAAPISVLHVRFDRDTKVDALTIDGARLQNLYPRFNYRIFRFDKPMQPGETRNLDFTTTRSQKGFKNSGNFVDIMDNGTFVNDAELTPQVGMDRSGLLQDRSKRRKYGLKPELRMPKLGDPAAAQFNYGRHDSDWVTADITVTTDADQTPMAPGYRVSEVVKNGRRTVHFVSDSPVMDFFSIQSARYAVATERYKGVDFSVYYDPQHPWNVQRIQRGMKASLDYYQANFSPYQFHQVRVLEFPAPQGAFAESFANTIPWSEGIFFIADNSDADRIDMVTYVGAHELGHQWWGHQVIGADEQGSTLLSETLAQYSAGMVMKHLYGPDMMRKFLKFELDRYLRERGGEVIEEEPIERVEGQQYIRYRKGSLVMYRLQDQIGEDAVNRALRHLIHDFALKGAPYPTGLDLVRDIRQEAPADKQALITDLFEKITLYDLKTTGAVAKKRPDGRYDLAVTVDAKKLYADGQGREKPAPMNESVDVGAFDVEPAKPGYSAKKVVAIEHRPIHSGVQTINLVVSRLPKFAGVDPYNMMIDRNSEDNVAAVTVR